MREAFIGSLLLMAASVAHSLGREVELEEFVARYPEQISWVTTCGTWEHADHGGFFRVIHAEAYAQSFLYIQWMETDFSSGFNKAVATLSLPRLNNDHADIDLSRLKCLATKTGIRVTAKATSGHSRKDGSVTIDADREPGKHRFAIRGDI
jgi:hypothetical protein